MPPEASNRSHDRDPKNKVRQGVTGHNVRYVLMISLGLSALALIAAYFYFAA
jgi:hypothetical protein